MFKPKKNIDSTEHSKKIRNAGDYRREKARLGYEAYKKGVLSKSRSIDEPLLLNEIGYLKTQVVYQPSLEKNYIWDIREKEKNGIMYYELYENKLESKKLIAPGYKKVELNSEELFLLLKEIYATKVSLKIDPMNMHGLDGTLYGLIVYENFHRMIKLSWWENPQEELVELDSVVKKYIAKFLKIDEKKDIVW